MTQFTIAQAMQLALQRQQAGRLAEAEQVYRHVLAAEPNHAEALSLLGILAAQSGRGEVAIELLARSIRCRPDSSETHCNLGIVLAKGGRLDEAISAFETAISLKPELADGHNNLGFALAEARRFDEAAAAFHRAIQIKPDFAEAYRNLGNSLHKIGRLDEAIANVSRAIELDPDNPIALSNLGILLCEDRRYEEAAAAFSRAIALRPECADCNNLGNCFRVLGRIDQAIAKFEQTIQLGPNVAEPHWNLSHCLLLRGDFKRGWQEYEWRWKMPWKEQLRQYPQPLWNGGELQGRRILLQTEQGFGDTIQVIRYLPLVVGRGGSVLVEVQPELIRLLQQLPRVEQWIPSGSPAPAFDVRYPLMSLPHLFDTTLETIPDQMHPLQTDAELSQMWRRRLEKESPGLRIGLNWAGNPEFEGDRTRSITLDRLARWQRSAARPFLVFRRGLRHCRWRNRRRVWR